MSSTRFWGHSDMRGTALHYWGAHENPLKVLSMCGLVYLFDRITKCDTGTRCRHCVQDSRTLADERAQAYAKFKESHEP